MAPPADTPYAIEYAYNLLGDVRGKRVLDLGCGSGENTLLLLNRGAEVHGVDISNRLLGIARRRMWANGIASGFRFGVGSAHKLPFPDESFEVIFGMATLHHFDLDLAASEIWRVLRPGGYGVFKEPVRNSKMLGRIRRLIPFRRYGLSPFERPLTDEELERFAGRFSRREIRAYQLPCLNVARWLPVLQNVTFQFYKFDHALLKRVEWLRRYATVRVIKVVK